MNKIDKLCAVLISFLMSLFLFGASLSAFLCATFVNPDFMIRVLSSNNYYETIYLEYCDEVEALAIPSGIEEGVFSSLISKQQFKTDINSVIKAAYSGSGDYSGNAYDKEAIYNKFYSCMVSYAENKGVTVGDDLTSGIDNVAGICSSTYETYVSVPFIDTIGSYAIEFGKYFKISATVCFVMFLMLMLVVRITRKWHDGSSRIISNAFTATGLMLAVAPAVLLISGKVSYINIVTKSLYLFAVGYMENILYTLIFIGVALILVVAVTEILLYYLRKRKQKI